MNQKTSKQNISKKIALKLHDLKSNLKRLKVKSSKLRTYSNNMKMGS
jgi:hypothetical protein